MSGQSTEDRLFGTVVNAIDDLEDAVRDADTLTDLIRDVRLTIYTLNCGLHPWARRKGETLWVGEKETVQP